MGSEMCIRDSVFLYPKVLHSAFESNPISCKPVVLFVGGKPHPSMLSYFSGRSFRDKFTKLTKASVGYFEHSERSTPIILGGKEKCTLVPTSARKSGDFKNLMINASGDYMTKHGIRTERVESDAFIEYLTKIQPSYLSFFFFRGDELTKKEFYELTKHLIEPIIPGYSKFCLLYISPSPRDLSTSRMPSSA